MNVFQKKQWTRIGLSIVALVAAALFLTGIIGGKAMTYRIGENDAELTAAEQGFGGEVTAHVVLNGDSTVKSLSVDTPDETAGLGQRASEAEFTDQFIGKAGPFAYGENGIEALSGATVTSRAALKAINRAITGEEAVEPAEEQPKEEKPAEEQPAEDQPAAEEKPAEKQPAETLAKAEESNASAGQVYGSYLSEKETNFSTIRVMIATKNDQITDCTITSEAKSEGSDFLTDAIKADWAKAIVENQTADTDAITGATLQFSAGAVKEAVAEIQQQMAGETPAAEQSAAEEKPAEEQPAEVPAKTEESNASAGQVYGSYLAEKETSFSTIRVMIGTKNDQITDCTITSEAKSEGSDLLTDGNKADWAKAIVETQGTKIDTVTGATISSDAVREAVAEIQKQIAGETPAAEEKPAEEPAKAEEAPAPAPYGGYLAVKETDFSVIRVIVSTKNGVITDCRIRCDAKEGQTDLVTDENEAAWAKTVVASQGAETDTVTGATVSSDAVREAVAEILKQIR